MTPTQRWNVTFYPPSGENYSPRDSLQRLCKKKDEQVNLLEKVKTISELEISDWPKKWVKQVAGIYQLTSGNFRAYFELHEGTIVVTHVCRKVTQKAKEEDIYRGKENFKKYMSNFEGTHK